jgi:hypothetical protein
MTLNDLFSSMETWPFTTAVVESGFWYPLTLSFHVLAMATLVGCIAAADLRLMGVIARRRPLDTFLAGVLPWTLVALAISVTTGALLFPPQATKYVVNPLFRLKFVFLVLAGLNALLFHVIPTRVTDVGSAGALSRRAQFAGAASILLWIGVLACGRLTAYF